MKVQYLKITIIALTALAIFSLAVSNFNLTRYFALYYHYLFAAYFIAGLLFRLPAQGAIGAAIGLLLLTSLVSLFKVNPQAVRQLATYAFYFLAVGLLWALIEYVRQNWRRPFQKDAPGDE